MGQTLEERIEFLEKTAIANLRDFFATSALSVMANDGFDMDTPAEVVAEYAYRLADAMMKERMKYE